ncbi:MAG: radical SAM protein [Planctomycetota bacterium]
MIKPVGATCNLRCAYCYYLPVAESYATPAERMPLETLESILAGYLPEAPDQVTLSWQGGEPTLAGLPWFEKMIELIEMHRRSHQTVNHCLQTNGTLLDDKWGAFLRRHRFLVGLSLDGLLRDHDHYRVDRQDRGTYQRVLDGRAILLKHGVEHNFLVVLNDRNVERPREVWRQLLALRADWVQFIPAVEWIRPGAEEAGGEATDAWRVAPFSPTGEAFGRFLCHVFDDWFAHHRTRVSVRLFDAILGLLVQGRATECTYAESCAGQLTLEHDGGVYGCDHFVEPAWQLGRVSPPIRLTREGRPLGGAAATGNVGPRLDRDWMQRLDADRFERFGRRKLELDVTCLQCDYRRVCHGGCPKHRPARGDRPGLNVLCDGYRAFFAHALPRLEWLAQHLRRGETPPVQAPAALSPRSVRTKTFKPRPRTKSRRKRR